MSTMPGWIVLAPKSEWTLSEDGRSVIIQARVRRWHPGLWVEYLKWRLRGKP